MNNKTFLTLFAFIFMITWMTSCQKEDLKPALNEDGLTRDITDLVPQEILDEMEELGMPINGGGNPPLIESTYLGSPFILESSNRPTDSQGQLFADYKVKFSGQDNDKLTIMVDYENGPESGSGIGSFIVGDGCKFSVFVEINAVHTGGTEAKIANVISGNLVNNGIEDLYFANFMIDNQGNTQGAWIENGEGRVIYDQDGFSELLGGETKWYSKLPDCPCEYDEDMDGREEMCGEWEDYSNGCLGFFAYLEDFHFGAKYEIRWAKDEDSPGQQCTYDANKKLITSGIAAGTPDKFGVVDPCNFNTDHNSADVKPWKEKSCYEYLAEWKPNAGDNCSQNAVNAIDHLYLMVGNMTCERITAIFKMIASSQNATKELKDYMKGDLNYTPTNLKQALTTVFAEYDCTDNLDETNCSALQEAINNL